MCKYCENGEWVSHNAIRMNIQKLDNNSTILDVYYEGYEENGEAEFDIPFCPFCGRNLTDNVQESMEILKQNGYTILKEETEEIGEKEYLDTLRAAVLKKAEEENFEPDMDELEAVMFEAYDRDMDLETAKEKVWLAVYMDKNGTGEEIE